MSELVVTDIVKHFGGVYAVDGVGLNVKSGTIHGLVGPNGAGKSTALGVISGFHHPDSGSISLDGRNLIGVAPARLVRLGLTRTFQEPSPLRGLTVLENVLVGLHTQGRAGTWRALVRSPGLRREERELRERAMVLLESVGLADRARNGAEDLSFGQLRFLEVARAVATNPAIVLLDEPAAGMGRQESERLSQVIGSLRSEGRGILLVDHDIRFIFGLCDEITVMDAGKVIDHGTPRHIEQSEIVRSAYLGSEEERGTGGPGPLGVPEGGATR